MMKQNKFRFCRKHLIIPALFAVAVLIAAIEGVSAKYMKEMEYDNTVVRAREFYFSSDLLTVGGETYSLNPGTKSITINLRNYDDALRFSEANIAYEVTVDEGATVLDAGEPKLEGGKSTTKQIQISNLKDGVTYTVTAIGRAGYEKTLSATFVVKSQSKAAYKYLEMDPSGAFVLLTVWTEDASGEVSISIPAGFIPDTTDSALAGMQNYNTDSKYQAVSGYKAGELGVYSSHTYRFFMEEPFAAYNKDQFVVTVGGAEATEKVPN